jgi:anti-sigma factor RsiW
MNNSDQPLTQYEETLLAYVDGRLSAAEAAAFEREHPEAVQERDATRQLASALRRGSVAPTLRNPDFFNRQIAREIGTAGVRSAAPEGKRAPLFNLWQLVFAGATCVLATVGIYQGFVAPTKPVMKPYMAEVLSMKTGDEKLTSRVISEEGLTFVMIDGLEPMSEEFILN